MENGYQKSIVRVHLPINPLIVKHTIYNLNSPSPAAVLNCNINI